MMARAVGSIIWTSMKGGTRTLTKIYMSIRRGRGTVKKGARSFYASLVEYGIPGDFADEITGCYANPGLEMLKIKNVIKTVREIMNNE